MRNGDPRYRLTPVRSRHWLSQDQEMRLKKLDCERNTCSHLTGESRMNCQYKCISEQCYHEIYGHDEVVLLLHSVSCRAPCSPHVVRPAHAALHSRSGADISAATAA